MNLDEIVKRRYATKSFNADKKISDEQFEQVKSLLRYSPSSVNSQPWHFIIADNLEAKKRIAKGTQGVFSSNEPKVMDASHVILFCTKSHIDDEYLQELLALEEGDGRLDNSELKDVVHKVRSMFVNLHRFDLKDPQQWMEKQVYLNLGTVLLGVAALGIDAVPIEGLDAKALNEEFNLNEKGYTATVIVSLGYRSDDDFNASLPKSRWDEDKIMTIL